MSYDCGKALRGWCRSFTKTERWLTVLEAIFLVLFVAFLTFLVLHLLACNCSVRSGSYETTTSSPDSTDSEGDSSTNLEIGTNTNSIDGRSCSWTPSSKTEAVTRYYLDPFGDMQTQSIENAEVKTKLDSNSLFNTFDKETDTVGKGLVLALVRARTLAFGCMLSVISARWTVTSAGCVDTIGILHHRDRFVIIGDMETKVDATIGHKITDVKIHPKYRTNSTFHDLCAIKSNTPLRDENFLILPTPMDYFLTVIGDRLTAFGYRRSRSEGMVCVATVRALSRRCARTGGAICAGRRGGVCGAGSPLLRGRTLLAVRVGRGTGDCAPASYRSIAPHVRWLLSLDPSINYLF